jgi:DMSO/TMAO reductase YedYZ heme-binding membrane subunit
MLVRSTGWSAFGLLAVTLAIGTICASWRRPFGLWTAAAAALHGAVSLESLLVPSIELLAYEPHLRAGASALVILAILALTSFGAPVRALGLVHWKALHRSVYLALALAAHHVLLSPHAGRSLLLAVAIGAVLIAAAKLKARRRAGRSDPLRT